MPEIDKFKQQVHSQGIMRGNRYTVKLFPPLALGGARESMERYASAVSMPGRGVTVMERSEFGETRGVGINHEHSPCSISFHLSEDAREKRYIEKWQDLIFNPVQQKRGYYSNYIGKIEIVVLDHNHKKKASYELREAYPINIGSVDFEWGDGTIQKLTVEFAYRNYLKTG